MDWSELFRCRSTFENDGETTIVYDNACNTTVYILNREPRFSNTYSLQCDVGVWQHHVEIDDEESKSDSHTEGESGDDQDSDDSGHDDCPDSIVDIELRSMVPLGPLNLAGVLLYSGQLNEFNSPGGGQGEVQPKQS